MKIGYRHIDAAAIYQNEKEVGAGIRAALEAGIKREDIFITSKLWNTKHDEKDVVPALKKTLSDLGLKYIDLYLIHWPLTLKAGDELFPKTKDGKMDYGRIVPHEETWKGMEECVRLGLTKHIGLSNFTEPQVTSSPYHPFYAHPITHKKTQQKIMPYPCTKHMKHEKYAKYEHSMEHMTNI